MSFVLDPFTHVIASRDGLFFVNRSAYAKVADGLFFGVTLTGDQLYCFEAGDLPWSDSKLGRIVRFTRRGNDLSNREILIEGLDNGCHQIDFFDGSLFVMDTYNQQVLEFDRRWKLIAVHHPIAVARRSDGAESYAHMNSFLGRGTAIFLLLHNGHANRMSEIVEVSRDFREQRRIALTATGCHDLVQLPGGGFLVCNSEAGGILNENQALVKVDALLTRGLSVGSDDIAVGSSLFGARPVRELIPGFVTFMDRSYSKLARLHLPAAPTQIRRLDGKDYSLSQPQI